MVVLARDAFGVALEAGPVENTPVAMSNPTMAGLLRAGADTLKFSLTAKANGAP